MTEEITDPAVDLAEARSHLQTALELLDIEATKIGHDLEAESENLRVLVAGKDEATQSQIGMLCQSVSDLDESLATIRRHVLTGLSAARRLETGSALVMEAEKEADGASRDPGISAKKAAKLRHDEPISMMSIIRSLLMADEPGQRERRGSLDEDQ